MDEIKMSDNARVDELLNYYVNLLANKKTRGKSYIMATRTYDVLRKFDKLLRIMQAMKKAGDEVCDYLDRKTIDDTPLFRQPFENAIIKWKEIEDTLFEEEND